MEFQHGQSTTAGPGNWPVINDVQYVTSVFLNRNKVIRLYFQFNSEQENVIEIRSPDPRYSILRGNYEYSTDPYLINTGNNTVELFIYGWHKNTAPNPKEVWHQSPTTGSLDDRYNGTLRFEDNIDWDFNNAIVTFVRD
uniref:Uncharacterized protein n=1 Tax=Bacillus phage PHBA67-T TaxID=3233536 RepID=A0AAU7YQX9_9CAUD